MFACRFLADVDFLAESAVLVDELAGIVVQTLNLDGVYAGLAAQMRGDPLPVLPLVKSEVWLHGADIGYVDVEAIADIDLLTGLAALRLRAAVDWWP